MSKHPIQGWAVSAGEITGQPALHHPSRSSAAPIGWLYRLLFWIERSRQRKALGELAERDNRLLDDIGVSKHQALREAEKPFWR